MRNDYILLDDIQQIMVVPHLHKKKWFTYDEIDRIRIKSNQRFPRMLYNYNETASWVRRKIKLSRKEN